MGLVKDIIYRLSSRKFIEFVKSEPIFPYYHIVSDEPVIHIKNLFSYKGVDRFKKDIDFLLENYTALSPQELLETSKELNIPKNKFLLTFDDGLSEVYNVIFPILREKNISAIFFVNPDFIGNEKSHYRHHSSILMEAVKSASYSEEVLIEVSKLLNISFTDRNELSTAIGRIKQTEKVVLKELSELLEINITDYLNSNNPYLSKEQIKEMCDSGFYFGGHTMSHPRLTELSFELQRSEVIDSIEWLKSNFDIDYSFFAFPFTDRGISKVLINAIFEYDKKAIIFGNSGIRKDISNRIIHRFSIEDSSKEIGKRVVTENIYKTYNRLIGNYKITRK